LLHIQIWLIEGSHHPVTHLLPGLFEGGDGDFFTSSTFSTFFCNFPLEIASIASAQCCFREIPQKSAKMQQNVNNNLLYIVLNF
jgi:hypothetical protein